MNFQKYIILFISIMIYTAPALISEENSSVFIDENDSYKQYAWTTINEDLDPLIDLQVTVEITKIRAFDMIDKHSDPDFYVILIINDEEYRSPIWKNMKYVENPDWEVTCDVPDDEENVSIRIQLWDWNIGLDRLCDIAYDNQEMRVKDINLTYNLRIGHWYGDDYTYKESTWSDPSGYGRVNGCDDNSMYQEDRDCELFFNIYQNDYDSDTLPYWTEVNVYETNPMIDDSGLDIDEDQIPIEWEHKWGWEVSWWGFNLVYSPFIWEDHKNYDSDEDGLDNYEEYLTSQWGSDPFRKDLFLEVDQMEIGPTGEGHLIPEPSKNMWRDAYHKHNIVFHLDDGSLGGGEILPFDSGTSNYELRNYYLHNFLQGNPDYWRRGVFHYGLVIYHSNDYPGFVFNGGQGPYLDSWQLSTDHHDEIARKNPFYSYRRACSFNKDIRRARVYAGAMMHETGHTLGIFADNTPGCDDQNGKYPWQRDYWRWGNYKSVMNYRYVYGGLDCKIDYSDGSHGPNDFDDWSRLDLQFFQRPL